MRSQTLNLPCTSPKRASARSHGRDLWYPYYAGFSPQFASDLLSSMARCGETVLDPWNGSGTTTWAANVARLGAVGVDLNPAMVVVARARMLSYRERPSILPLAAELAERVVASEPDRRDPLTTWLVPKAAHRLRTIERRLAHLLATTHTPIPVDSLSPLAAFFYVALFRTVRLLTSRFVGTNPTWTKRPRHTSQRLRPSDTTITTVFCRTVAEMAASLRPDPALTEAPMDVRLGSSQALPLNDEAVDLVLTSPPYCTRIDYAVATLPELAVLGIDFEADLRTLRNRLLGTSTIARRMTPRPLPQWGVSCNRFLESVESHQSKDSASYYYKNHIQYFAGLYDSLSELSRVLRVGGYAVLVVQDSHYKDIHNDLAATVQEMLSAHSLKISERADFHHNSVVSINRRAQKYHVRSSAIESVIVAQRTERAGVTDAS